MKWALIGPYLPTPEHRKWLYSVCPPNYFADQLENAKTNGGIKENEDVKFI